MKKIFKSQFGFNTIELLVGVAILAIVALAGATLSQVATQATNYPDRKAEVISLGNFIMENLKNEKTCTQALQGNNLLGNNANGYANNQPRGRAVGRNRIDQDGKPIWINNIPNLQAGTSMNGVSLDPTGTATQRQILTRRLQIENLDLKDGILIGPDGSGNNDYLTNVYMEVTEIGSGFGFQPQFLGAIVVKAAPGGAVVSCQGVPADAVKAVCASSAGLGCTYDPNETPACRCLRSQRLCLAPGYYPVGFKRGEPDCRPLGGGVCANPDEYLVGIELEKTICAPVPTTCPAGSSTTGLGNPIAGLIRCKCNVAGATYYTGSGCTAPAPTAVAGVCGTANGTSRASAPTTATELCSVGSPTTVTGSGPWMWKCSGANGGSDGGCVASSNVVVAGCTYRAGYFTEYTRENKFQFIADLLAGKFVPDALACTPQQSMQCELVFENIQIGEPCTTDGEVIASGLESLCSQPYPYNRCKVKCVCTSAPLPTPVARVCDSSINPAEGWIQVETKSGVSPSTVYGPGSWGSTVDPWYNTAFNNVRGTLNMTIGLGQYTNASTRQLSIEPVASGGSVDPGPQVGSYPLGRCTSATNGERGFHGFRQPGTTSGVTNNTVGMDFAYQCNCP